MPDNGIMDADDFRIDGSDAPDDGSQTIQDPLSAPAPSPFPPLQNTITDPALKDLVNPPRSNSQTPPTDADTGTDRYRHQQSRADKALRLAEEQAKKISDLEAQLRLAQPIVEMLSTDEELARMVDQRLATRVAPGMAELPQKPQEPALPDAYNEAEAFTNPQSDSYKYRKAREKYVMDNQKYLESLVVHQQTLAQQREQAFAQRQAEQRQILETQQRLVREFQLTPVEAQDFLTVMTSPESVSTENLVRYWRFLRSQPVRQNAPAPPTGNMGGAGQARDVNQMFNDHIFAAAGKPRQRR